MNLSPSALGLPASPYLNSERKILILSGPFAQHIAAITQTLPHGGIRAVVVYGHMPNASGRVVLLRSGDYVRTNSPTCPALPKRPQPVEVPAYAAG